jgi:hypothetical protein
MKKDRNGNVRNARGECVKNALGYSSSVTENLEYDYKPDTERCSALQEYQRILPTAGYKPAHSAKHRETFSEFNIEGLVQVDENRYRFEPPINGVRAIWQYRGQLVFIITKNSNALRIVDERLFKAGVYDIPLCKECGEPLNVRLAVNGTGRRVEMYCGAKTNVLSSTGTVTVQCPFKAQWSIYAYTLNCSKHLPEGVPLAQQDAWQVETRYILPQAREKRERLDYAVYSKSGARKDNLLKSIQDTNDLNHAQRKRRGQQCRRASEHQRSHGQRPQDRHHRRREERYP